MGNNAPAATTMILEGHIAISRVTPLSPCRNPWSWTGSAPLCQGVPLEQLQCIDFSKSAANPAQTWQFVVQIWKELSKIAAVNMEQPHVRDCGAAPSPSMLEWLGTEGSPRPGWCSYAGASFVKIHIQVGKHFCCTSSFPHSNPCHLLLRYIQQRLSSRSPPLPARPLISGCHKRAVALRAGPSAPLRQARQASALSASEWATGINTSR